MRETQFIAQNQKKWAKFELALKANQRDPEELSKLFIEITDDLSYSRTFYPNRSVRVYLNGIAQRVFYNIYKNKQGRLGRFINFWVNEVPQILFESRRELLMSLLIFLGAVAIGVLSSMMDADFPRVILGDEYVMRTYENIANGTPMSVYSQGDSDSAFFFITTNNLRVALMTFAVGIFLGLGTTYLLIYNGIMVGAFQTLFIREGIYWDSVLTIWVHGTIEISCIILAGGAGLVLGRSLAFPNTYTRLQSIQLAARRGILIMATITPLIILAGFIESYVTRVTDAPYIIRGLIIGISFLFILGYFVIYPYFVAKRGFTSFTRDAQLPPSRRDKVEFHTIKNSGELFSDTFVLYRQHLKSFVSLAALVAGIYTTVVSIVGYSFRMQRGGEFNEFIESLFANVGRILFPDEPMDALWWLNCAGFAIAALWTGIVVRKAAYPTEKTAYTFYLKGLIMAIAGGFVVNWVLTFNGFLAFLIVLLAMPILLMWQAISISERDNIAASLSKSWKLGIGNYSTMLGSYSVILFMGFIFLLIASAPIVSLYSSVLTTFIPMSAEMARAAQESFYIFTNVFILFIALPLVYLTLSVSYFSFKETQEANDLLEKIPTIGTINRSFGLEHE